MIKTSFNVIMGKATPPIKLTKRHKQILSISLWIYFSINEH